MFLLAGYEGVIQTIVTTIASTFSLYVHFSIAWLGIFTSWTPQDTTLVRVGTTIALETIRLTTITFLRVPFEDILRTIFRFSGTIFGQITFIFGIAALGASHFGTTCCQVTAFPSSTRGICMKHTGVGITTGVFTIRRHAAVTLFARFDKAIATLR